MENGWSVQMMCERAAQVPIKRMARTQERHEMKWNGRKMSNSHRHSGGNWEPLCVDERVIVMPAITPSIFTMKLIRMADTSTEMTQTANARHSCARWLACIWSALKLMSARWKWSANRTPTKRRRTHMLPFDMDECTNSVRLECLKFTIQFTASAVCADPIP